MPCFSLTIPEAGLPNMVMSGKMATKTDENGTLAEEPQRSDSDPQLDSDVQFPEEEELESPTSGDPSPTTPNGDMNPTHDTSNCDAINTTSNKSPILERKSRFATLSRIFKPWKWKRRKKPSEKIEKQAVDLERKISVRTPREELVRRGVLREIDGSEPIPDDGSDLECSISTSAVITSTTSTALTTTTTTTFRVPDEEEEAVQEEKGEGEPVQANGTSTTAHSVHLNDAGPPCSIDSGFSTDHEHLHHTPLSLDNKNGKLSTTQAEVASSVHSSSIASSQQVSLMMGGEPCPAESPRPTDPKQIRVMVPVEERDRNIPVLQRVGIPLPVSHESTAPQQPQQPAPMPKVAFYPKICTPPPPMTSQYHPLPGTLPPHFTMPQPSVRSPVMFNSSPLGSPLSPVVASGNMYQEVLASEPDLEKRPLKSALKGSRQHQQQHQQEQLQAQLNNADALRRQLEQALHNRNQDSLPRNRPPRVAPKPRVRMSGGVRIVDPSNKENQPVDDEPDYDNLHQDDSDDEIHYRDDDSDEDESVLAAKVRRQDSLARFLNNRPGHRELMERNILPMKSEKERLDDRTIIGHRLNRRLSLRPTEEELKDKNILHTKTLEELQLEREEKKRTLIRKLSFRPTVDELKAKKVIAFNDYIEVTEANEYDRRADKPWTRLTPKDKAMIRKELNEFKSSEMQVHDDSRHLTRFHRP